MAAAALDGLVLVALFTLVSAAFALGDLAGGTLRAWYAAVLVVVAFGLTWGYFLLFEGLGNGRTPGKRYIGIRVLMDTGHPVTFGAAVTRNLVRIVDAQPLFSYGVGLLFVFFHPQNKRLGDIVAGTVVVRDRPEDFQLATPAATAATAAPGPEDGARAAEPLESGPPELDDREYRLLEQFLERADQLDVGRRKIGRAHV